MICRNEGERMIFISELKSIFGAFRFSRKRTTAPFSSRNLLESSAASFLQTLGKWFCSSGSINILFRAVSKRRGGVAACRATIAKNTGQTALGCTGTRVKLQSKINLSKHLALPVFYSASPLLDPPIIRGPSASPSGILAPVPRILSSDRYICGGMCI